MVFRALFLFEIHIQQRWYLTGGNSSGSFIRRKKTEHFKILQKSITTAQKCKNILLQAARVDFWSSANPKLKKNKFAKTLTSSGSYWQKCKNGVLESYFCLQWIQNIAPQSVFRKKLNFEGLRTYERHGSHLMMS